MSAVLVEHEQRWLPELAPRLPLPVPAPLRLGRPGRGYPWAWSVLPWLPGTPASELAPDDPVDTAERLGGFVAALAVDAPADAPANPYRGGPLVERDVHMRNRVEQLDELIDGPAVLARWNECLAIPPWAKPPRWLHGDLHPANLLVHGGRIAAVVDFGDISGGDPANDLAVAWMMLPANVRAVFRTAAGAADDDTWERARGWALFLAVTFLANSRDNTTMARIGRETLAAALTDDGRFTT